MMRAMLPPGARLHGAGKLRREGLTGRGVKVAVIDTGVTKDHAGFNGKVINHFPPRKEGEKLQSHGTHVAGTIQ
jgi:subtilisin family serine protease